MMWRDGDRVQETGPSLAEFYHWAESTGSFEELAAWEFGRDVIVEDGTWRERVPALQVRRVTERYFEMLGVAPLAGHSFAGYTPEAGAGEAVILGHGYWKSRFGGAAHVIGRSIRLDGAPAAVVGVLPEDFFQGQRERLVHIWRPLRDAASQRLQRDSRLHVEGRIRGDRDSSAAEEDLTSATVQLVSRVPELAPATAVLTPFSKAARQQINFWNLRMLAFAAAAILLIACVNAAALATVRSRKQARELMIRGAVGASPLRLFTHVFRENMVLALLAGIMGGGIAWAFLHFLVANTVGLVPVNADPRDEVRIALLTAGVTAVAGLMVGVLPALRASRLGPSGLGHGRRHPGSGERRLGRNLVIAQVALAVVLVNAAGLMVRSLYGVLNIDPGFDPDASLVLRVVPVGEGDSADTVENLSVLLQRVRELPFVAGLGAVDRLGGRGLRRTVEVGDGSAVPASTRQVTPELLVTLGVSLRAGRLPRQLEAGWDGSQVVLGESLAVELFGQAGSAVGQFIELDGATREVIAVIGDVNHAAPRGVAQREAYVVADDIPGERPEIVVRVSGRAQQFADELRRQIQDLEPGVLIDEVETLRERFWSFEAIGVKRQQAMVLASFAGIGLLLGSAGVFALALDVARARRHEVGVRIAVGDTPFGIVRLVVADTMIAVIGGVALGVAIAIPAGQLVADLLVAVSAFDIVALVATVASIALAGFLAALLPSFRVSRLNPRVILDGNRN